MSLFWELVVRFSVGSGQRRFTRFVALASLLGMMLGVAALITVLSVMNGFSGELHQRLLSVTPDMTVLPPDTSDENLSRWASLAIDQEGVTGATQFHSGTVLLRAGTRSRGTQLIGASRAGLSEVLDVGPHLVVGELVDLEVQPFTVVLGADLARLLRVDVGDSVEVLLPRLTVSPLGVFPRSRALTVVGLFAVGAPPDAQVAYVSQHTADKLLGRTGERGVQLRLTDRSQVAMVSSALASVTAERPVISDWRSSQGSLFAAIKMEKITVGVLLTSVILVAAFNLVSTLTLSVTEKRSDIAILQVLGLTTGRLLMLFLGHGMMLAAVGITLGTLMGVSLALSISDLSLWIEALSGRVLFDPAVYYIGGLPSVLQWGDVLSVIVVAAMLSLMASVYPAWRASQIPPAEALNYV